MTRRSDSARLLSFGLAVATALLLAAPAVAVDSDADGVDDIVDNCTKNVNPHQEDSDGDGAGDVCDGDTINALFEGDLSGALHARTPSYRMRYVPAVGLEIAPEGGIGAPAQPSLGVVPPSPILGLRPGGVSGLVESYLPNTGAPLIQSTWQTAVAESTLTPTRAPLGTPDIDLHLSTNANGVAFGYEIPLAMVGADQDVDVSHALTLPAGWSLDTSEIGAGGGVGRITVLDDVGAARLRIGAVDVVAFGSPTAIADSESYFGLARLSEELDATLRTATVGPPDLVGSNFYGGIHAPLVQTSYSLDENMAEGDLGELEVVDAGGGAFALLLRVPTAFVERNRATSADLFVGARVTSLTPVDLGSGEPGAPARVYGRHLVLFDDEADVMGSEVALELHDAFGTFDGAAPDYALFPNGGGSAAAYDAAAQQQTVFGCTGCTMTLAGEVSIAFVEGGVGVGIAPGPRVPPSHPCISTDPLDLPAKTGRCAAGRNKRATFSAERLVITGSMSGLVAGESDVALDELVFHQAADPNVTDPTLLHAVMGLGCAADAGLRLGINPSNGDVMGNAPFDLSACTPFEIGQGTCLPPALGTPASTGLCNLRVNRVELFGMGSTSNPLGTDPTLPSGDGIALHMQTGDGQIGDLAYDRGTDACVGSIATAPSVVLGFETLASFSGGANVRGSDGQPLAADDADAVPENTYCITNVRGDELAAGLVAVGNVDVRAKHLQIERTLMGALGVANGAANIEDVSSTTAMGAPCRSVDGETCATPVQELACPGCKQNGEHFLAITSSGKSAPTRVTVTDSVLGLDPSGPSSGGNPALPPLVLDENLVAIPDGLTIGRRPAELLRTPVQVSLGADTMFDPTLFSLTLVDNNIGVDAASISIDNYDSAGGALNLLLSGNCYSPDGKTCLTEVTGPPVLASAAPAGLVQTLNADALSRAASEPNPAAGTFMPEPDAAWLLAAGLAGLAGLHARRERLAASRRRA